MKKTDLPKFIELFAGIGLVRLGLERAGWKCVYANDIDAGKQEMYAQNFSVEEFHLEDIWKIDATQLPKPITLLTASFPCVDLSLAGNRKGLKGKHSRTFWAFIDILEHFTNTKSHPPLVMVENVMGFMTSNNGKDFLSAIKALNKCGYSIDAFVIDAKSFIPQSRPRLFIIGIRSDLNPPLLQAPATNVTDARRPQKLRDLIQASPKLKWALLPLPKINQSKTHLKEVVEILTEKDSRWWNQDKTEKTLSQMSPLHRKKIKEFLEMNEYNYCTIYRRKRPGGSMAELRTDGIAGCLRTPRGGSSRQIVAAVGKGKVKIRWMTPREYARLQGVPDSYSLPKSESRALFGFGDAVCVPVIEWIANNVLNPILSQSNSETKRS